MARRLLALASSPYEARRDSTMLDASLVELLVSRAGGQGWHAAALRRIAAVLAVQMPERLRGILRVGSTSPLC